MALFGGELVDKSDLLARLLEHAGRQSGLGDLASLLPALFEQGPRKRNRALVWPDDHTIPEDWEIGWIQPWVDRHRIAAVACFGHLTVEGDLLNLASHPWPLLYVAGDLRVRNLVKSGLPLFVQGNLLADGYVVSEHHDEGLLRVGGDLVAAGYIPSGPDRAGTRMNEIAGSVRARFFDARVLGRAAMRATFVPEVLTDGWYDPIFILEREHEGLPVWRDPSEPAPPPLEEPTPPPLPPVMGVDPVGLGTLTPARQAGSWLRELIAAAVPHDPDRSSYPEMYAGSVRHQLEKDYPGNPVLILPPGTRLSGDLELDWDAGWVERHGIAGVACAGDLTVDGDILNRNSNSGPLLFVGGKLRVRNLIKGGSPVLILGDVEASGLVVGDYNDGRLLIHGDLWAQAFILLDHAGYVHGTTHAPTIGDLDNPREMLVPEVFADPYEDRPSPEVDWLWARQRAGLPVLKSEG